MASKYWIKLYHEILDDPKMGRLTDRLFRRTIQVFLLAGDYDKDGVLPSVEDMAWRLRVQADEMETDLADLASTGIVQMQDNKWVVAKFSKRQAASTGTERWRQWKERQRKKNYYQTERQRNTNDTLSDTDIDKEKDIDKEPEPDNKLGVGGFYFLSLYDKKPEEITPQQRQIISNLTKNFGDDRFIAMAEWCLENEVDFEGTLSRLKNGLATWETYPGMAEDYEIPEINYY